MTPHLEKPRMSSFLSRHDLVYEAAPLRWDEGLPLGNGSMGVVVWGDGSPLKLTVDSYDLWDLRSAPLDEPWYRYAHLKKLHQQGHVAEMRSRFVKFREKHLCPTRLPGPRIEISFGEDATDFHARLALGTATARGRIALASGPVDWEAYVASERDVFILRISHRKHQKIAVRAGFDHLSLAARRDLVRREFPRPQKGEYRNGAWLYQAIPENGGCVLAWRRVARTSNDEIILVTFAKGHDWKSVLRQASARLDDCAHNLARVRREHVRSWRAFWSRSFLTVPDAKLESLFYAEMYKFGSCGREDKFPISLQGPWGPDGEMPNWQGDYHLDLDIPFCYSPAYASNHLDCAEPLYSWAWRLLPRFEKECRTFFGCEGVHAPCALGPNGERVYGYLSAEHWPGNGAWLAFQFWQHFLYSQDESFLRDRAYPFMRGCMLLYEHLLEEGVDGRCHLPLSVSPEYGEDSTVAWGSDTTCDLGLIRLLASALLETVERLGLVDSHAAKWRDILHRLASFPTEATRTRVADEQGKLAALRAEEYSVRRQPTPHALFVMQDVPYNFSHRHLSHLMPIYPLGLLGMDGDAQEQQTIHDSVKATWLHGQGGWVGFTFAWAAAIGARASLGEFARRMLTEYATHFVSPNTFHMTGDYRSSGASSITFRAFLLEAGFTTAAAIVEMLLQSHGGRIRLFPAVPIEWRDAAFHQLRAEGAFLISAKRQDGEVAWVEIQSEKGRHCAIVNPFGRSPAFLQNLSEGSKTEIRGELLTFPTKPGGAYRLHARPLTPQGLRIASANPMNVQKNPYGVKRWAEHDRRIS